jgi:hypothetical protein
MTVAVIQLIAMTAVAGMPWLPDRFWWANPVALAGSLVMAATGYDAAFLFAALLVVLWFVDARLSHWRQEHVRALQDLCEAKDRTLAAQDRLIAVLKNPLNRYVDDE